MPDPSQARTAEKREKQPQLPCPSCGYPVSDVQPVKGGRYGHRPGVGYRRLRRCRGCGAEYTSVERVEAIHRDAERSA